MEPNVIGMACESPSYRPEMRLRVVSRAVVCKVTYGTTRVLFIRRQSLVKPSSAMILDHLELLQQAFGPGKFDVEDQTELSSQGANYLGVVTSVTLHGKNPSKTLRLIVKAAQGSQQAVRSSRAILPAFERELELYQTVLPGLASFQAEFHLSSPFVAAACFAGSLSPGKEALVLDDLRPKGFQLCPTPDGLDFCHQAAVFREYARLHAVSLAFRDKAPEQFLELTRKIERNFLEQRAAQRPELYEEQRRVVLAMGKTALDGQHEERRQQFEVEYRRFLEEEPEEELLAVCHGDCHPNNILFQYAEGLESPKVALIDWQLSSLASPMRDLTFVLFACASKEALDRRGELLLIYHASIRTSLQEFGCEADKLFSYETLQRHWNKYSPYGLYRAQVVLKLMLLTPEERAELEASCSILEVLKKDFATSSKFAQRVRALFAALSVKM
ncbi:hypothetical protein D910_06856 [Dendroctonus ponderosae]|uniref:CHK kinase-like domain-containing protein n=2 Tax=Dendroctonus ponderosae TaxID=77166 RepID=U4UHY0_DENPD|nr:hypothetical protein D910_06856 [Dendroctonus ponderosae]